MFSDFFLFSPLGTAASVVHRVVTPPRCQDGQLDEERGSSYYRGEKSPDLAFAVVQIRKYFAMNGERKNPACHDVFLSLSHARFAEFVLLHTELHTCLIGYLSSTKQAASTPVLSKVVTTVVISSDKTEFSNLARVVQCVDGVQQ